MADRPDYFAPAIVKGAYNEELLTLAVDGQGRLIAMVKALYNSTVKDVLCDVNGNLTLNIKTQDLAEIINRPKYGAAEIASNTVHLTTTATTTLFTISGKGMIYGGILYSYDSDINPVDRISAFADYTPPEESIFNESWKNLVDRGVFLEHALPLYLLRYDTVTPWYVVAFSHGITFESDFTVKYTAQDATDRELFWRVVYALV